MSDSQKLRQLVYDLSTGLCPITTEEDMHIYVCMQSELNKSDRRPPRRNSTRTNGRHERMNSGLALGRHIQIQIQILLFKVSVTNEKR